MASDSLRATPDWPKHLVLPPYDAAFRMMLPSGAHCDSCHGLVTVDEANIGMTVPGFYAVFDVGAVMALLTAHVEMTCSRFARAIESDQPSTRDGERDGD